MQGAGPSDPSELPLRGGNAQVGCGLVVREIKGHRYVYFWAYETRSWGAYRDWSYVGPIGRPRTRSRARELLIAYHLRASRELDRRISALQAAAARNG